MGVGLTHEGRRTRGASMIAVSLPFLLGCAVAISIVLLWLNRIGVGAAWAAAATVAVCVAIALVQSVMLGGFPFTRQAVQIWTLLVLVPGLALFAASRLDVFHSRPWLLLLAGPLLFLLATTAGIIMYNVFFTPTRSG